MTRNIFAWVVVFFLSTSKSVLRRMEDAAPNGRVSCGKWVVSTIVVVLGAGC